MSSRTWLALAAGVLSAVTSLAFLSGVPAAMAVVHLAPLPLFAVGLSLGVKPASIAVGGGIVTTTAIAGPTSAALFGLVYALPAWMVSRQMLTRWTAPDGRIRWYPPGHAVCCLAALGAGLYAVAAIAVVAGGGSLAAAFAEFLERTLADYVPGLEPEPRAAIVGTLAPFLPGFIAASWVLTSAINGVLAQGLLVRMGHNLRPSPTYADLRLPEWSSWLLVAAAALALLGTGEWQALGRNLALIFAVPYFLLGLAVVHTFARRLKMPGFVLGTFYLILVLFALWAHLVVAGVGVVEQWEGIRRRLPDRPGNAGGDEENRRWK